VSEAENDDKGEVIETHTVYFASGSEDTVEVRRVKAKSAPDGFTLDITSPVVEWREEGLRVTYRRESSGGVRREVFYPWHMIHAVDTKYPS